MSKKGLELDKKVTQIPLTEMLWTTLEKASKWALRYSYSK